MCSQPAITLGKGGVAILIHKNVNFTVLNTVIDPEGRFLIIKLSIFDKSYVLLVYMVQMLMTPLSFTAFLPHSLNN